MTPNHYFGTDELYLGYLSRFVRPGGMIGVVVPGLAQPLPSSGPPPHLTEPQANGTAFWEDECASFHTADWWHNLWQRSNRVEVLMADPMPRGWEHWRDFERALDLAGRNRFPSVVEALERDRGRYLTFVRLVGRCGEQRGVNLYDPSLMARMGLEDSPAEAGDPNALLHTVPVPDRAGGGAES